MSGILSNRLRLWQQTFRNNFITNNIISRVDVSETFSADQLWFRTISGLFQRCSLPENLWTALKTEIFRAKNQRWNSAVSALIFSETELIQSWTALISSETALNRADLWIIQNDNYWFTFHYFQNFSKHLNFEAHTSGFQPSLRKEVSNKILLLYFCTGQRYNKYLNFWVYSYCSSNKTDMVQLFKNIFAFIGGKIPRLFQEIWVFAVNLQNFYLFFNTGIPF